MVVVCDLILINNIMEKKFLEVDEIRKVFICFNFLYDYFN